MGGAPLRAGYKQVDQGRVAAFAKRLAGTALMAEAGEAVGALGVTRQLLASYPRTRCLLENERIGTGVFNMVGVWCGLNMTRLMRPGDPD